jgi:hypothetical protein
MKAIDEEKSVLRWGGLAGILGGIVFVLVFVVVIAFVGPDPAEPEGRVMRFPDIRAARTVEDSLYLVVLILWVTHFLALYRALRGTSLAPALFGSVLGIVGLGVLAAGALPHVATAPISTMLPRRPQRIRRHSSSYGRRPRAYSMRCSAQDFSSCL